jgi:hypothetical protein
MSEQLPPPGDPYQPPPEATPTSGHPVPPPGQYSAYPPPSPQQPAPGQPSYGSYGQPVSGDPNYGGYGQPTSGGAYGQPTSGQPGYGAYGQQPTSGQPYESTTPGYSGYPTTGYPTTPGYGATGYPEPPAPKKRTGLWIALGAVLLALCLGGGAFAGALILANDDKPSSSVADPSADPSSGTTDPNASASPDPGSTSAPGETSTVKVVAPAKLLGQPKLDEPELNQLAESTSDQMKNAAPNVRQTVSAFYGDISKRKLTMVIAVAGDIPQPAAFASGMTIGLKQSLKAGTFTTVPSGSLGGTTKCADARASDIDLAVCIWSDRGSFGIIGFYYKKVSQVKADFLKVRQVVEVPA